MELSYCVYPFNPTTLRKHLLGRGCHWLRVLVPTAGLAGMGSLKSCILSGFLSGSAKYLWGCFEKGKKKERKKDFPHFYANKNIFDLYTVYMLHKSANYSPKKRRNRTIFLHPTPPPALPFLLLWRGIYLSRNCAQLILPFAWRILTSLPTRNNNNNLQIYVSGNLEKHSEGKGEVSKHKAHKDSNAALPPLSTTVSFGAYIFPRSPRRLFLVGF